MTTQEFINKMAEDETLAKKMSECKSPEEAYEVAKESGLTDDIEIFKAVMTEVNRQVKGELSDDELENIAGGKDNTTVTVVGFSFGLVALVSSSIAASAS